MGAIPKEQLPAIIERLQKGSSLGQEAKALGMSYRTTLIMTLREYMGREAYDAMIEAKRPMTRGGVHLGAINRPRPEDSDLPVVSSMGRSLGWTWRYVTEHELRPIKIKLDDGDYTILDGGDRILIMMSPEGVEYVAAEPMENAHLLRVNPTSPNGPSLRFVEWETSRCREKVERNHSHDRELMERGATAHAAKRAQKTASADQIQQQQQDLLIGKKPKRQKKATTHDHANTLLKEAVAKESFKKPSTKKATKKTAPKKTTPKKTAKKATRGGRK